MEKIILFGFGIFRNQVYQELKEFVVGIIDNDKNKWGKEQDDLIIYSPQNLKNILLKLDSKFKNDCYKIVIASSNENFDLMKNQILQMGIEIPIINANDIVKQYGIIPLDNLLYDYMNLEDVENLKYKNRYFYLFQLLRQSLNIQGSVVECGVYRGDSAIIIAKALDKNVYKKFYLMDTFEGMPKTNAKKDLHKEGDFIDTSISFVKNKIDKYYENTVFLKGLFANNFHHIKNDFFCFVHIDCDIYSAVKECIEFFYYRVVEKGIIVFDDYGYYSCPGAREAIDKFLIDKPESLMILDSGQAFIIKS